MSTTQNTNRSAKSHPPLEKGDPCLSEALKALDSRLRGNDLFGFYRLSCRPVSTSLRRDQSGSALVIAIIVLVILGALGLAALDVAEFNIFVAANDRDSKEAFFHADSGVNVGHEFLEVAIENVNSTFYSDGTNSTNANIWGNSTGFGSYPPANFPQFFVSGGMTTQVRSGWLDSGVLEGSAMQIGAGYEGVGKGAASGGTFTNYLIRSHREGRRNSQATVDLGWRHINY